MALSVAVRFKEREEVGFVETGNAAQCRDRRAHLAALQGTEETHGNVGGLCHFGEGEPTTHSQAAKFLAGALGSIGGRGDQPLFFQDMDNGRGIQPAGAAQENSALQKAHVSLRVHAVVALSAARRDESQGFPGAQSGRGNADAVGDFTDAQEPRSRQRFRWFGQILSA